MAERKIRLEWRPDVLSAIEAERGPASATILGAEAVLRAVRDVFAKEPTP